MFRRREEGDWRTLNATFELAKLSVVSRAANFTISVPGIDLQQKELRIAAIDVTLRRAAARIERHLAGHFEDVGLGHWEATGVCE